MQKLNTTNTNWFEVHWRFTEDLQTGITLPAHDLATYLLGGIDGGGRDYKDDDPRKTAGGSKDSASFGAPPPVDLPASKDVAAFNAGAASHESQRAARQHDVVAKVSFLNLAAIYDYVARPFLRDGRFMPISRLDGQIVEGEFIFTPGDLSRLKPGDFNLIALNGPQFAHAEPLIARFAQVYAERLIENCRILRDFPPPKKELAQEIITRMLRGRSVIDPQ